jgi:hypothetical protein
MVKSMDSFQMNSDLEHFITLQNVLKQFENNLNIPY